jgi:uncharacterized protein (DUF1684 family)
LRITRAHGARALAVRKQDRDGVALTLHVPQPLPEPQDSYCVVISE